MEIATGQGFPGQYYDAETGKDYNYSPFAVCVGLLRDSVLHCCALSCNFATGVPIQLLMKTNTYRIDA
ncbi:MAG TPA: hypothetical protein VNE63_11350 [Candidatus Acidoferrales bacterium]|nr:hypothetical protein [Candidatus Acidoferrales bacterium]